MKTLKQNIILLLLLLTGNMAAVAANKVYVEDFTATAGSEVEVSICLNTDLTDIDLIEGTITFPSHLLVVENAYGSNARVKVNDNRASGFMGNFNPDNGSFRLQAVSSTLTAGNGAIAYMKVKAASNLPVSSTVTLSSFRVRHKSGAYEDITAANAAVTGQAAPSASINLQCAPSTLSLQSGTKGTVELQVQTTGNITGLQGVLTVGNDITIANVTKGAAAGSPVIFNYNPSNGNFVYFGSMDNVSGTLLTLEVEASSTFGGSETITLGDIVATDATAVRITLDDVTLNVDDNTTGIDMVNQQTTDDVYYNLSGQKVDGTYKGVVIRNGKKVVVK